MKRSRLERRTPLKRKRSIPPGPKTPRKARQDGHVLFAHDVKGATRKRKKEKGKKPEKRRPATPDEKAWMRRVRGLGCFCCRKETGQWVMPDLHHIREGYGAGERASHWEVLPLCEGHHQGNLDPVDPAKLAFHKASKTWKARYGTEVQLLQLVYEALGERFDTIPERRAESERSHRDEEFPPWWDAYQRGNHDLNLERPDWVRSLTA